MRTDRSVQNQTRLHVRASFSKLERREGESQREKKRRKEEEERRERRGREERETLVFYSPPME